MKTNLAILALFLSVHINKSFALD